jgi:hypothetical protein
MRLTAFFSGAMIVLAITPTQMAALDLIPSCNQRRIEPSFLISQQSQTRRIQFAPGAVSAVVEGGVVRGTRNIYLLRARRGQTIKLNITSVEQNAVFDIQAPNGRFLQQESTRWRGVLPVTGDYSVIVGGTRGNATYKLDVTIE